MSACPDIDSLLEDPRAAGAHLDGCAACRGVSALGDLRHERMLGADDACERAEISIALLHEGLLSELEHVALTQHLEACGACNETAARVLALPVLGALPPSRATSPNRWRLLAMGLGATTLVASAAALALFLGKTRVEPVPLATAERVPIIEAARPAGAPNPPPAPPPTPKVEVEPIVPVPTPPKLSTPPPIPTAPPAPIDPFVGSQTNSPPHASRDELVNPWGDTGFISVLCNPRCDSVSVGGKSLGPSPVVRARVSVGKQLVTGRFGGHVRSISVVVKKGETSAVRIHMNVDVGF